MSSREVSGMAGPSAEVVLSWLLARSMGLDGLAREMVCGLDGMMAADEERKPRSFSGDDTTKLGELKLLWGNSAGDGREDVGLAILIADDN